MDEKFEREINGVPYLVYVKGNSTQRTVQVMAPSQDRHKKRVAENYGDDEHFYVFYAKDKREAPLPDMESHVADAVNKAVCRYEDKADRTAEMRESIDSVLDAVESVHDAE